jgi:hypothetical protein
MNWTKTGESLACGSWKILRFRLASPPRYELWDWPDFISEFSTSDEAKAAAEQISRKAA